MTFAFATGAVTACASMGAPPGGPDDKNPPVIVSVTPDSGATNVKDKRVVFRFDEVVSDIPTGGKTDLNQLFLISPMDGTPNVSWHRYSVDVRPRKGFRSNTAYSITLLPGLVDLRGNARKVPFNLVFTTGSALPRFGVLGRVFDWAAQRPAPDAYVEALSLPDSVRYVAVADSAGEFTIGPFPAGTYLVRAILDRNNNRALDRGEPWDTTRVTITDARPTVEMLAIERDSDLVFADISSSDSVTLNLAFDKWLKPTQVVRPENIRVQRADSSQLEVVAVQSGILVDSLFADSTRRADSLRLDSLRRADTTRVAPTPPAAGGAAPSPLSLPAKPALGPPSKKLRVKLSPSTPLVIGQTYRITAHGVDNLAGPTRDVTRTFTVPRPTPRDTTRRLPGTPLPARPPTRPPPPTGAPSAPMSRFVPAPPRPIE